VGVGPDEDPTGLGNRATTGCPFHPSSEIPSQPFEEWLETGLRCSAGKREFQLDRYSVAHIKTGEQFNDAVGVFRRDVAEFRKTGLLAIVSASPDLPDSVAELRALGQIIVDAGYAPDADQVIDAYTVAIPFAVTCPVTGIETDYEFFPVAFCRHAACVGDPLYDPSLSAPFLAINMTSDAFAFGMLVRDLSHRHFHCEPYEISDRRDFDRLLDRCAGAWQNMSINTIRSYNKVSETVERAVDLSEDQRWWTAPHNDPVFAELVKETHSHEMPIVYARRLCDKWKAVLFDGEAYRPTRDGQSGGVPIVESETTAYELY
jgi:hypothetical protein